MTSLEAALEYLARGWSVLPCEPAGKQPLLESWSPLQRAPATEEQIRRWWGEEPDANVAVVTGAVSGVVVVDVDGEVEAVRDLPPTLTVRTRRGRHHYYRHPGSGVVVPNRVRIRPGVDVRGDGGYVLAPPSLHPDGAVYEWENDLPIAPLPSWVMMPRPAAERPRIEAAGYWQPAEKGGRHDALVQLAGHLLARGLHPSEVEAACLAWNERNLPSLPAEEVRTTVWSLAETDRRNHPERYATPFELRPWMELEDKETQWLVRDLLPAGFTLLVGRPKGGKSRFVRHMLSCLARGEPFLGRECLYQGSALYLFHPREGQEGAVREHFRALETPANVYALRWQPGRGDWAEEVAEACERAGVRLVVLDTLGRFLRLRSSESNDYDAVNRAIDSMEPLLLVASVVALHHASRDRDRDVADAPLGATSWAGSADAVLSLERLKDDDSEGPNRKRLLRAIFRDAGDLQPTVLSFDGIRYVFEGHASSEKTHDAKAAVYELLASGGWFSTSQIARGTGYDRTTVQRIIRQGIEDCTIRDNGAPENSPARRYTTDPPEFTIVTWRNGIKKVYEVRNGQLRHADPPIDTPENSAVTEKPRKSRRSGNGQLRHG